MNTASTSTTLTESVYGLIAEKDWDGAIETLSDVLQQSGPSQAVLSLLGHCQSAKLSPMPPPVTRSFAIYPIAARNLPNTSSSSPNASTDQVPPRMQ